MRARNQDTYDGKFVKVEQEMHHYCTLQTTATFPILDYSESGPRKLKIDFMKKKNIVFWISVQFVCLYKTFLDQKYLDILIVFIIEA